MIMPKTGVHDPQGDAIANALRTLGFSDVHGARQGKMIEIEFEGDDAAAARQTVVDMCEKLLANTVIESYRIHVEA